jgi:uncharacterized membrane-anchored protein YitT (DUF2179 family)
MEQMGRGATILRGVGAFTHQDKPVLFVVVGRSEVMRLKTLILERDPSAFISVSEASEVMGEGFTLDANRQPMTI